MAGFLIGEALRDLRRAGRVAVAAVLLITLSLAALGGFWLVSTNVGQATAHWRDRVRIIVYLKREPPAADVHALMERVQAMPDVGAVRYVSKAEALGTLKQVLGKDASVAEQLPANPLPASLEVTPTAAGATPDAARALIATLAALPEADEVGGGIDWIERLARGQRLLDVIGLGVGAVLALAAILTVTTATTLVLHARREELEIMRLVGAPELVVRAPLLLQGMLQGLVGAVMAIWVLIALYTIAGPRLEPLVSQTLGLERLTFLRPQTVVVLMFAGTMLGGFGGWLARGDRRGEPRCLARNRGGGGADRAEEGRGFDLGRAEAAAADREAAARGKAEGGGGAGARDLGAGRAGGDRAAARGQAARGRPARHPDQARGGRREVAARRDPAARNPAFRPAGGPRPAPAGHVQGPRAGRRAADVVVGRGSGDAGGGRPAPHQPRLSGRPPHSRVSWDDRPSGGSPRPGREPAEGLGDTPDGCPA